MPFARFHIEDGNLELLNSESERVTDLLIRGVSKLGLSFLETML
jgi:hypothetical protein